MESFGDSNCHSMSDSFSLYERYLRSFNVVDSFVGQSNVEQQLDREYESSCEVNIDLSDARKHCETAERLPFISDANVADKVFNSLDTDFCSKIEGNDLGSPLGAHLSENSSTTADHSILTDKSNFTDVPVSSEDSKSNCYYLKQPVFITSTMENSNNAVDSVPLFRDVRPSDTVFKLPIRELSFNGTIKHVQKLKPIVDPITALSSKRLEELEEKPVIQAHPLESFNKNINVLELDRNSSLSDKITESSESSVEANQVEKCTESTSDSQYEDSNAKPAPMANYESSSNMDQSYSSMEASFDSGVRSPDIFSDEDGEAGPAPEPLDSFWGFLKDFEAHDKKRVRKFENALQGILPPPSVTTLKTDVTEMLKKYYNFLPLFTNDNATDQELPNSVPKTPSKRVSFLHIPVLNQGSQVAEEMDEISSYVDEKSTNLYEESANVDKKSANVDEKSSNLYEESANVDEKSANVDEKSANACSNFNKGLIDNDKDLNTSTDNSVELKLATEIEMKETVWPDILKCRFYDVNYNVSTCTEKVELLAMKYGQRYVGAETECSVTIYSGHLQSPNSASKRKALRLKLAQAKSPGRRLSHLARRRQAFCSAATINEKANTSGTRMVLIDKKKLISSSDRKSPRTRRTPGKKTPTRKTPGKKTPRKTPKSGGSSKKKAMRRLLMDPDTLTRSQPTQNTIKRALFISPDNRKPMPQVPSSSVPAQAMKSKRALFGSPPSSAQTKSLDGTASDQFMKRKLSALDEEPESSRSKMAKSLSFGGDTPSNGGSSSQHSFSRRASEYFPNKSALELSETHKKKLLWAVSEALRVHGWRMSSPGFREKASALARLTRRLLSLPVHAARLKQPTVSTSETMLKLARQYVFAIIQGQTIDECFLEEQAKLANSATRVTGYISATAYQQLRAKPSTSNTNTSRVKENIDTTVRQEHPRSNSKNILQDKLVNIDTNSNSNSSSGLGMIDRSALFKSNSMPSFEAAKMRARRQISFDNVEFPKR